MVTMFFLLACAPAEPLPAASVAPMELASTDLGYDAELATTDLRIAFAVERAETQNSWLLFGLAAAETKSRARLTGDYDDYAAAEALLVRAEELAPDGSGPFMHRAGLDYTLHRLDRVEASVASAESAISIDDNQRAAFAAMRGDVAWQRGDLVRAEALFAEAQELHWTPATASSQAHIAAARLDFDKAEALFDEAEDRTHGLTGEPLAWYDLQRGLLDLERGRYDEALEHYLDAEDDLSGYWLVREHIAEILVLQGDSDQAEAIYLEVVEGGGGPEFMDALAGLMLAEGRVDDARHWIRRADEAYARQMEQFPEAAAGHALGHALEFGDAADALVLAERNAELRPNASALAQLASAQLANQHPEAALHTIESALAVGTRSTELHLVAAEVYASNGQATAAQAQLDAALAINPSALD